MSRHSHDPDSGIYGLLFWGCILTAGILKDYSTIVIIIFISIAVIYTILTYYWRNQCSHGVFKGDVFRNGCYKCSKCQAEYLSADLKYEEERKKREKERFLEEQYKDQLSIATKIKRDILLSSFSNVSSLTPFEFEDYIAYLLGELGFTNIKQTSYTNDGGKDIICSFKGITYYVECKLYKKNKISRPMMQKLFAAMSENKIEKGIFFTTSSFTSEAIEYGKKYHIRTIDGDELVGIIAKSQKDKHFPLEYKLPCPKCGSWVSFRYLDQPSKLQCPHGHFVESVSNITLFPKKRQYSGKRILYSFRSNGKKL